MTNALRTKTALATFAGLAAVGTLAGCSATSADAAAGGSGSSSSGSSSSGSSSTATYKDGTYSAPGTYVSPGGQEDIKVTLTLSKNVITAMKVVTVKADPTARAYEQQFESGISAVTVGKNINSLNIGVVAGSSLTSLGFNQALATIKADAKS